MNNVLENKFFSKLGRLIRRPKSRFSIHQNHNIDIQFTHQGIKEEVVTAPLRDSREEVALASKRSSSIFETNPLPKGTLECTAFKAVVEEVSNKTTTSSTGSFLIEMSLNQANCAFLTAEDRRDLAIDCLKKVVNIGLSVDAFTFSSTDKIWLLFEGVSNELAINKANIAFRAVQKLLREELDFHRSLVALSMYKVQDCVPEIF